MLMRILLILIFILPNFSLAFNKQKKAKNNDLRHGKPVFTIENSDKNSTSYALLENNGKDHSLEKSKAKSDSIVRRISGTDATRIDELFVSVFVDMKYMMPAYKGKNCRTLFKLTMRGEEQTICKDEKDKLKKLETFVSSFEKEFGQ
jgi:hypothetical protein